MANPMDIQTFSQLGMGMASLLILWFVVQYFIKTLTKKDRDFQKIVKRFNITINNHIAHETEQSKKQTSVLRSLVKEIKIMNKRPDK